MSDDIKPSDYTSSPPPAAALPTASLVAAPLPGQLSACSSRCSLSEDIARDILSSCWKLTRVECLWS
ncbi:hypothetical protein Lser_V15G40795 [Lactuca serriola]